MVKRTKKAADLVLDEEAGPHDAGPTTPPGEPQEPQRYDLRGFIDRVTWMIEDGRWEWSYDFLSDVRDTVERNQKYTLKQKIACQNIYDKRKRDYEDDFDDLQV